MRTFMRLEQLFQQMDHFLHGHTIWDSRAVIDSLLEMLTIFSRNDIKSEILKELDRHSAVLSRIAYSQNIDRSKLEQILEQLEHISAQLYQCSGKIGTRLMESELFKSISQRTSIPGGTCSFDLPLYHYWLQQSSEARKKDLEQWMQPFTAIRRAIDLILRFIRHSSLPTQECAKAGFFQETLDRSLPYQLLRITLERAQPYFAEISGGKHRFTIRFMSPSTNERPMQTSDEVSFQLTRCLF